MVFAISSSQFVSDSTLATAVSNAEIAIAADNVPVVDVGVPVSDVPVPDTCVSPMLLPSTDAASQSSFKDVIPPTPVLTSPATPIQDLIEYDDDDPDPTPIPDHLQMDDTPGQASFTESPLHAIAAAFRKAKKRKPPCCTAKLDPNNGPPLRRSTIPVLAGRKKSYKSELCFVFYLLIPVALVLLKKIFYLIIFVLALIFVLSKRL